MNEIKCRVKVSAELEVEVSNMGARARREMAKKLRNWAHQLEFSAVILEVDAMPKPLPKIKWLPPHKLKRN